MGEPRGFLEHERVDPPERDPAERVRDWDDLRAAALPLVDVGRQGARCMECGVPFCHDACPVGNRIPEWNELVRLGDWRAAIDRLHATNAFPELTGMICPAPCESACVLEINDDPVTIKQIELAIVEKAFAEGWVTPRSRPRPSPFTVAVVGSGPAGMAAAARLNERGHGVVLYERDERAGGLNRFGVPDAKLPKAVLDRRLALMEEEGVSIRCGVEVSGPEVREEHDAVVVCVGAREERALEVPGADLDGVHSAMDYLYVRNRAVASGDPGPGTITARDRRVVVIGAGDTSADCLANALRENCASAVQLDTYPAPSGTRPREIAGWPRMPKRSPTHYALDEGAERVSSVRVTEVTGAGGRATGVRSVELGDDREPVRGTDTERPADLVLVAIGFTRPEHGGPIEALELARTADGLVAAPAYATSADGVFAAGDARLGATLTVTAIDDGQKCATAVHEWLTSGTPTR
jgi:glutamate synthase (NADPH) small chain